MTERDEKQAIEEMARDLCECYVDHTVVFDAKATAENMVAKGYRKQIEGEWIAKKEMYRTPSAKNYYCSNCEKNATFDSFMGTSRITKYCPNCGAKMKGGAE